MISHHIYLSVAQAHKESQMEAARQAHQARSLRRLARTSHPRRSFLNRIASRLDALNYADGHGVGTARYVRDADDPQAAAKPASPPRPATRSERRPRASGSTA
jgi:hypothetical protein